LLMVSTAEVLLSYQDLGAHEARASTIQLERERCMPGCGPFVKGKIVGGLAVGALYILGGQRTANHMRDAALNDLCPDVRGSAVIDPPFMHPPSRADTRVWVSLA
jgi:hypothetical protein